MSGTNGRPEPEVIVNFQDGYSYSKGKMEEAFRVLFENKSNTPKSKEHHTAKKDDVDFIIKELDIPRHLAEKALANAQGNLTEALRVLITPEPQS